MRDAVLAWYRASGRLLPFRATSDPYAILVSEVMAQQTQIDRVAEAWTRFIARFPTIQTLASASPADVLRQWRGMGYDRRALNLHRLARLVVAEYDGELPRDVAALQRLPGVGPYTARAVAALAFGVAVAPVDTNVRRVIGRAGGLSAAAEASGLRSAATDRAIQELADASVPADDPGEWTQALMDIGATLCRPRAPRCVDCPAAAWCRFALDGVAPSEPSGARAPGTRAPVARAAAPPAVPFEYTNRWLRGRILDRLRDARPATWVEVGGTIGSHAEPAVRAAVAGLAADGMLERDPSAPDRVRLRRA